MTWSDSKPNFPGHERAVRAHPQGADRQARVPAPERQFRGGHQAGRPRHRRATTNSRPSRMPAWGRPARSPTCATASATIWTSTQKPYDSAYCVAELLGLPREKVRAIWMFGTGSYGRNEQGDATADAAVLSKHLGRPVRVQYMRHEGAGLGSERHGLDQPQPRRSRRQRQGDRLREHQQGVLAARQQHPRDPRRRRAGRAS